jgi:hypothetical protein
MEAKAGAFGDTGNGWLFPADTQDIAGRRLSTPDSAGD